MKDEEGLHERRSMTACERKNGFMREEEELHEGGSRTA
jgi:hypothetical protein